MGLTLFPVLRLKQSWEGLGDEDFEAFKHLCSIFTQNERGSFPNYEKLLVIEKNVSMIPCFRKFSFPML